MYRSRVATVCSCLAFLLLGAPLHADLVSHWNLDGDLQDSGPGGNHGQFFGFDGPFFDTGFDDSLDGAIVLDGVGDYIEFIQNSGLPIYLNEAYSVAMWVRGLPQNDRRIWSDESSIENSSLFNIGTERTGNTGQVDIFIRTATGALPHAHTLSEGIAFDGEWHHIAWVDDNGQAVLYIDGVRDAADFTYTKPDLTLHTSHSGAVVRDSRTPPDCCWFNGMVDDIRVYDHALTEEEVLSLVTDTDCPAAGDTHCGELTVDGPPGLDIPGLYTLTALGAADDSGDEIIYTFSAESDAGAVLRAGPQSENVAEFNLGQGAWTLSVTVDDDRFCPDAAGDATCTAAPVTIDCPAEGDTHCDDLEIIGPLGGGPGLYALSVLGATDDSNDEIIYTFSAENEMGQQVSAGPQMLNFADLNLGEGTWDIEVRVDDDPNCPDEAPDAVCAEQVIVGCPEVGDTHCDDLVIDTPEKLTPGTYEATVLGAADDSGDLITYTFVAESTGGTVHQVGPQQELNFALFTLGEGTWTIRATVDDDPLCDDVAGDATCSETLEISGGPPRLLSHWTFDGDTDDSQGVNDGIFFGDIEPNFVDGFDNTPGGAILFDGVDDFIEVVQSRNLPLYANSAFSIAMWVNGGPQPDFRVWSEGSTVSNTPLFNIGTQNGGITEEVDIFIRSPQGTVVGHRLSDRLAFDFTWHHIAWVDDNGRAALYIDGIRDATDFSYSRPHLGLDTTTIGGILRAASSHFFQGAIDDVRVYNYAITEEEVIQLVPEPEGCPDDGDTHCDDLVIDGPENGFAGIYTLNVTGASDDSGDPILYTFVAENEGTGQRIQAGPQEESFADFDLFDGTWNVEVTVDDELLCRDEAEDARCSQQLVVLREPEIMISHWKFDGDLLDSQDAENHGTFIGEVEPPFVADRSGNPGSALRFDGLDDYVLVTQNSGLPLYPRREFSIAMWVNGGPQGDDRVWSEGSTTNNTPLFNIGTERTGATSQVDIFIRPGPDHRVSAGNGFDNTWHHIAYVDVDGEAALYIDGKRDPIDFTYGKQSMSLDTTTIGGILRATPCCLFTGMIDDVRIYNYALTAEGVREAMTGGEKPKELFRRGDTDTNGTMELTDAIGVFNFLFITGVPPRCFDAADADDNAAIELTDGIRILNVLFLGFGSIPSPGFMECGEDPSEDGFAECVYGACP